QAVIFGHDHLEPVRQGDLLEFNLRDVTARRARRTLRTGSGRRRGTAAGRHQNDRHHRTERAPHRVHIHIAPRQWPHCSLGTGQKQARGWDRGWGSRLGLKGRVGRCRHFPPGPQPRVPWSMARYTLVYGIRLIPEGSLKGLDDAKLTLADGSTTGL